MSGATSGSWTHIRIRRETLERLKAFASLLDRHYARTGNGEAPGEQGYAADQLVNLLLDRDDDHRERSRRASIRRQLRADGKGVPAVNALDQG